MKHSTTIFVYGDISKDWFVYEHARDGDLLRKLIWCSLIYDEWNSVWVCVQGESEDLESTSQTRAMSC